jgi:AraC-like DNA-binding protein
MLRFEYKHIDYVRFTNDWAAFLGLEVQQNKLQFPPDFAIGYIQALILSGGLQLLRAEHQFVQPFHMIRNGNAEEYYILRFDITVLPGKLNYNIDQDEKVEAPQSRAAATLVSTLFETGFVIPAGMSNRNISILFSREWLAKYLDISRYEDVLKNYLMLKTANFIFEPIDIVYREWFEEILAEKDDSPLAMVRIESRVMQMVERFFSRLLEKKTQIEQWDIQHDDIRRAMEAEKILMDHLGKQPPTIEEMAKDLLVSPTKLKKDFKEVYRIPMYEYYQRARMNKAKDMLLSGDYSVKEVGHALGYSNLSHFTFAFKKAFSILPSEITL